MTPRWGIVSLRSGITFCPFGFRPFKKYNELSVIWVEETQYSKQFGHCGTELGFSALMYFGTLVLPQQNNSSGLL